MSDYAIQALYFGTAGKDHPEVVLRRLPSEMADFHKNATMTSRAKSLLLA